MFYIKGNIVVRSIWMKASAYVRTGSVSCEVHELPIDCGHVTPPEELRNAHTHVNDVYIILYRV